jgi:hypothetical protein
MLGSAAEPLSAGMPQRNLGKGMRGTLMRSRKIVAAAVVLLGLLALPFFAGFVGDSAVRIRREHGLKLPSSASQFECKGDAWITIMDRGASSTFVMARSDMPSFVAQLKIRDSSTGAVTSIFPGNAQYQVSAPWRTGVPIATHYCRSPTGDSLAVQFWSIDEARVGVCLYTDWN